MSHFNAAAHPRNKDLGHPGHGGQFGIKTSSRPEASLRPYANLTPTEIDTELAELYEKRFLAMTSRDRAAEHLERHREASENPTYHSRFHILTPPHVKQLEQVVEEAQAQLSELDAEVAVYSAEFKARGGWSRFFLVDNSNGHVHSSMDCSTCFPTTRFSWLPDQFGKDEAEIVEAAGDKACTVCFPSAPVADPNRPRPNTLEPAERKAAREAREAARAERAAKAAASAIYQVNGEPLREVPSRDGSPGYIIKTERTAMTYATDRVMYATWARNNPDRADDFVREITALNTIVEALAARRGVTVEQMQADLIARAQKKHGDRYDPWS